MKNKTSCIIIALLWLFGLQQICGKSNLAISQLSTKNGLSQNTVRSIIHDKNGFIWAGTLEGLNRYDGYKFTTYKPMQGDPYSISDHRVKDIYQDRDSYIWIKTYKNEFSCYDPKLEAFVDYNPQGATHGTSYKNYHESPTTGDVWLWSDVTGVLRIQKKEEGFVTTPFFDTKEKIREKYSHFLFEDSRANIWTGGTSGLYRITDGKVDTVYNEPYYFVSAVEKDSVIYFVTDNSLVIEYDLKLSVFKQNTQSYSSACFTKVACLSDDELLITTQNKGGVVVFNTVEKQFSVPQWGKDIDKNRTVEILTDAQGGIWLYNGSGKVWYYNIKKQKSEKFTLIPKEVADIIDLERYNILVDSQGLIWITTYGNGFFCYNPETEELNNYIYQSGDNNSPASDYLLSITEDVHKNIWIGSEYAGIIKVVKPNYDFQVARPEKVTSIGRSNNIRAIHKDSDGNIWIGAKNGSLYVYDSTLVHLKHEFKDINSYTLVEDNEGAIWIGTKGNGVFVVNRQNYAQIGHYYNMNGVANSLSNNQVFNMLKDSKGRIWIGTFGGGINLVEKTASGVTFRQFISNKGNKSYIRHLMQDHLGDIWVGTSEGVLRFDPEKLLQTSSAYKTYDLDLSDCKSLSSSDIKTIFETKNGEIWIGTAGGGVNKYVAATDSCKEHFVAITSLTGLSDDMISGILEDKKGNLWISSENGITQFNEKENSFTNYSFSDKTYGNHFNENANVLLSNGLMLWGTLDGMVLFDPYSFTVDTNTPKVALTDFYIYDQRVSVKNDGNVLDEAITYADKILLSHKQNTFSIEFATLSLKDPGNNKYSYILEGYDTQWSTPSHANSTIYKNLPYGEYTFKVKGTNSDGYWNDEATEVNIIVEPPIWRSSMAYVVYFFMLLGVMYLVFRIIKKFNSLNNNIKLEKELTNHKLRFFTNISHEFRTPLTLIRGSVESLKEQIGLNPVLKGQINTLARNSVVLTRLIDQLLEFRKLQNNILTLDLEKIDIIDFLKEIFTSFDELATQKKMNYAFESNRDHFLMYIDRKKVDKIIYNLLSNAFKFTPKGGDVTLTVHVDENSDSCSIAVKDNGEGVAKDKQHLLFSRFMQINFSTSGTGVGLSLAKEFIDAHKGKIWYESNQPQGSIFHVELSTQTDIYEGANYVPTMIEKAEDKDLTSSTFEPMEVALPEIDVSILSGYNLLIIDDNDDIRQFLHDEFAKYMEVDTAENGKEGLAKAIETNPDLIICDVMMPEMDGFEVTRCLKRDFQTCHIPIILLTAHSSLQHQMEGIESGADAYIMKPFSLKYLITRVFKLVEQREQLKKRFSNEFVFDGDLISSVDQDKKFFNLINRILDENLSNSQFSVDRFAELAQQRRTLFYKKVKGLLGVSPNELIKVKRMNKAAELLLTGEYTVAEVAYQVGYEDPFYFSKSFKSQFNCAPSKYVQGAEKMTAEE